VYQHIRALDQSVRDALTLFRLQVDADALLTRIDARRTEPAHHRSKRVAVDRLDLDHTRTEVGEHRRTERRRDDGGELDDGHSFERPLRGLPCCGRRNGNATAHRDAEIHLTDRRDGRPGAAGRRVQPRNNAELAAERRFDDVTVRDQVGIVERLLRGLIRMRHDSAVRQE
jgi:hypothetical protein